MATIASHNALVSIISASTQRFFHLKQPFRIYHGSTNSTRPTQFDEDKMIDTSELSNVLEVDTKRKTALVEPNVAMEALVQSTLTYGLLRQVVMEFAKITVGGGFSGTSGESSSFRHGFSSPPYLESKSFSAMARLLMLPRMKTPIYFTV